MVPKYIYLKNVRHKRWLNPMKLALCLAVGNERTIAKQVNSLLGLSLNWYVKNSLRLPFSPGSVILRHFW